jgi:hypothetical protein
MTVKTAKVAGRRQLHFESLEEAIADAQRMVNTDAAVLGNWSLGQILMHLARSVDASIDGFGTTSPWYMRLAGRLLRRRFLTRPMPAGIQLSKPEAAILVPGATEPRAGLKGLREAIARLPGAAERASHPVFGALTRDEWNQLHLRHAELHLSFVVPHDSAAKS